MYYDDGIYMKGTFADNLASGKMKIFKKDGSYKSVIYNKGIPAGFVEYYDADGKWIKQDFYYRNALLSDLIKSSLVPDYSKLFSEEDSYKGKLIKITGIVEMMEESDQSCYFKIKDQKGNKYICQYNNLTFNLEAQTLIPNIDTGDQVTIYGYFQSITRNIIESDKEDYGFSFPEIDPFYGVKDEKKEILRNELKFTYKDIYENAYYYFKVNHTWEGKVSNLIYQDKYFIMELELPSQDKIMIYVKKDKWNTIPVPGDTVKLEGYVRGYYKRIFGDGFIKKYPYIQLTKRITKESKDD